MPYTMEDFRRDYAKEHFKDLTPQEKQEAIKGLTPEEKLEALKGLTSEEVLAALTPEQLEQIRQRLLTAPTSDRPSKRRGK